VVEGEETNELDKFGGASHCNLELLNRYVRAKADGYYYKLQKLKEIALYNHIMLGRVEIPCDAKWGGLLPNITML